MAKKSNPLPPPPAELSPELLASLPPPPPGAEPAVEVAIELPPPPPELQTLRLENADLREEVAYLRGCNDRLQAELAGKSAKPGAQKRNFAFELANGSRQIRSGATEAEARAKLGAEGETAKFKGCLS
jgi:hypothetical protein